MSGGKKKILSEKDEKAWLTFTKQSGKVYDKEKDQELENKNLYKINKLDLHGFSLEDANAKTKKFILESFNQGYKKLLIVTGKGLRSKINNDPYRSKKMNVLKHSVPEYIKNEEDISKKIKSISMADIEDGGEGAIYVFLKR